MTFLVELKTCECHPRIPLVPKALNSCLLACIYGCVGEKNELRGIRFHIQLRLKLGAGRKLDILSINNEPGTILGFKNMEPKFEFET